MKKLIIETLAMILLPTFVVYPSSDQCLPLGVFYVEEEWYHYSSSATLDADVNNDGYKDIIVGISNIVNSNFVSGVVYALSGLTRDTLFIFNQELPRVHFEPNLQRAGDVNNDEQDDIVIGSIDLMQNNAGKAYVFSGQNGDTLLTFTGEAESGEFARSVTIAGDVNNDGFDDLIIGSPGYDSSRGRAFVISGNNGDTLFVYTGSSVGDKIGWFISFAGDVNNDGYDDFLLQSNFGTSSSLNKVYVYSGQNGAILNVFTGGLEFDGFGYAMSSAGDVNNDGYDDVIIGAPNFSVAGVYSVGRAYVFSGFDWDTLYVLDGEGTVDIFGFKVASAGDVDHDGFDDFLVAARNYGPDNVGRIYVFSGQYGDTLQVLTGESYNAQLGSSVGSGGDFDGDGHNDMIVGSWNLDSSGSHIFRATVYPIVSCRGNRGDINGDSIDAGILDLTWLVDRIFRSGSRPSCFGEADVNSDGSHGNILDLTFLVDRIFRGGPAPGACY